MTTETTYSLSTLASLRTFLRRCSQGQSLNVAYWAAKLLKAGKLTEKDIARCFALGFNG